MITQAEWRPTPVDRPGAFLPDQQNWIVAGQRNRDSGPLAESNFQATLEALGGEGKDVEVHRFRHWGIGWCETILVRPDTDAAAKAEEIEAKLASYPVLNDEDFAERQQDEYLSQWNIWAEQQFVRQLTKALDLDDDVAEALEDLRGEDRLRAFYEAHVEGHPVHEEGSPSIGKAVKAITLEDVVAFLAGATPAEPPDPAQGTIPLDGETA